MSPFDLKTFTYGVELEFADVDRTAFISPALGVWNTKDYSIVSSNGLANDPEGKLIKQGGEINVQWSSDLYEVLNHCMTLYRDLKPTINYRCNLHVHVGVPGLIDDLEALKQLHRYVQQWQSYSFNFIEPIPMPTHAQYPRNDEYEGAIWRFHRRFRSHQWRLPKNICAQLENARTPKEFLDGHAPLDRNRKPAWQFFRRAGINICQLVQTNTVEFRHFPGAHNELELRSALEWCKEFMDAALNTGKSPMEFIECHKDWVFPKFELYQHKLELGWKATNFEHHSRSEVEAYLRENKLGVFSE